VSAVDLVQRYLLAVAGPLDDEYRNTLQSSARTFMTPDQRNRWAPRTDITVVRVIGDPIGRNGSTSTTVDIKLQPLGSLGNSGALTPNAPGPAPLVSCQFEVIVNPDRTGGWLIDNITSPADRSLASAMLLSSDALDVGLGLFTPQLVYYWPTADSDGLVPDLRYLPVKGSDVQKFTAIVNDLLSGPPDWLDVNALPSGMKVIGPNLAFKDSQLVVNLTTPGQDPNRLMTQLRWSLYSSYRDRVQLQANYQPQPVAGSGADFLKWNLADQPSRDPRGADEFCVAGGVVRPLRSDTPVPQVLNSNLNGSVVWAALSRDKAWAAVVRDTGGGRYGLWLGQGGNGPGYVQVAGLPAKTTNFSRPVWLPGQARVLVLANNRIWAADMGGKAATDITPSGINLVKAFSVAPDGRRIALIADDVPAIASLSSTNQPTVIGSPQQRFTAAVFEPQTLSAIAWTRLERVIIAGHAPGGYGLVEMTIDGAVAQQLTDVNLQDSITHLVAYPPLPSVLGAGRGKVLGQAQVGRKAYSFEYVHGYSRLPQLQATPSPSPSGSPGHPVTPTAPFFAD
jgi:hypothetical protein